MNQISPAGHAIAPRLKAVMLGMIGSFVLFSAYLAVPPIGVFSGVLAPFPIAHTRLQQGRLPALTTALGTATAVTALFGIFAGCLYLGMCGTIGFIMPELLSRGFSGSRAMFWTTLINLAVLATGLLLYSASTGHDLQQLLSAEIADSLKQASAIYEKGGIQGEDLELLKQTMNVVADLLHRLYPALISTLFIVMAVCNLALLKRTNSRTGLLLNIGEFASYKNPDPLVWVLIAAGFSMLLPDSHITTPALNIVLLVSLLYFFQGMAVLSTVIMRQSLSGILRIGLYVMLILQPYMAAIVAGIGLCDLWVDFRTPKKQENL